MPEIKSPKPQSLKQKINWRNILIITSLILSVFALIFTAENYFSLKRLSADQVTFTLSQPDGKVVQIKGNQFAQELMGVFPNLFAAMNQLNGRVTILEQQNVASSPRR